MNLGNAIKLCRTQRKMTQSTLAEKSGISAAYLSLLERNERSDPGMSTVEALSKALKVPLSVLMFLASDESERGELGEELSQRLSSAVVGLMTEF